MPRLSTAIIALAVIFAIASPPTAAMAQAQPPAPIKPYKPVAVRLPAPFTDASFAAFRKQLAEIAGRKDRAALAGLVVAQGFFWQGEKGDKADKSKSGIDNLAAALELDAQDGAGWEQLASYARDPAAAPVPAFKGVICSPPDPLFNDQEFENLLKATQTNMEDWGYPLQAGVEVRATRQASAPVIEKLGLHFVRVLVDESAVNTPPSEAPTLRIVMPSGKTGFIPAYALAPLGNDQLCYRKDADGWKIAGYVGGDL